MPGTAVESEAALEVLGIYFVMIPSTIIII